MTQPFSSTLRIHGKSPKVAGDRSSYSFLVRDAVLSRLKALNTLAGFAFAKTSFVAVQPQDVPFCGVYFLSETMTPEGDANAGEVRFRTTTRLGISIVVQNNDAEASDMKLDQIYQAIMTRLFSDDRLYNDPNVKVQGFTSGTRLHVFGNLGKDNEIPIAELRLEIGCDLGTIVYEPYVPDDLEIIHVTTDYPDGTPQVQAQYDLEQNS